MNENYSLLNINQVAKDIIKYSEHKVLLFHGEMGAGKTTLIKEICKELGSDDSISSPTFSIVNEYITLKNDTIYHFDFYRINSVEEAYNIGIEDYFFSGHWNLIEWPENISNLLPPNSTKIEMNKNQNGTRTLNIVF